MPRVQLALNVDDIDAAGAGAFYSELFSAVPAKRRPGYANFAIDDPALKLVLIENPGSGGSLNHLGVEVTSTAEVIAATRRLAAAGLPTQVEEGTTCCYALQDKVWPPGRAGSAGRSTPCSPTPGGELEGTSPTSVPSPPPRPAAPLPPAASVALARSACAADRPWGRCTGGSGAAGRGGGDGTDVGEVPSSSLPASRARCRPPSAPRPARWPHLVLQRIAAGGALLDLGRQPRRGEPAGGGDDLRSGSDLHAQVVEAAAEARVLDEDQLQRRVVDGEVGVPQHGGEELRRCRRR